MLVLSRRPGQKVVFPGLGITIEVMRSAGAVTRLGIEAPHDVKVFRDEVLQRSSGEVRAVAPASSSAGGLRRHELLNRLNQLMLKLQLLQKHIELGQADNADSQLSALVSGLHSLEQATRDSVVSGRVPQVLVVDDQRNECELLATCLRLAGVQVATAHNGREAFDYLHEHDMPDLVLLDMRMPDVDGPEFLKLIRADIRLHDLRVFAVTGSERSEFSASLPVDGWFGKPVRIDSLLAAVHESSAATAVPTMTTSA